MRRTVVLPEPDGPMIATFSLARDVEIELVEHREVAVALGHVLEAHHRPVARSARDRLAIAQPLRVFSHASTRRTPAAETRLMTRKNTPTMVIGSR